MHPVGFPDPFQRTSSSLRVVALIPSRFHSTRLDGKALADIAGRPMIEHVYRRTADARGVNAVVVATDDERIRDAVERFGGVARMTRGAHATGTDRIAEIAAELTCGVVVNVQGDEPLIEPETIAQLVEPFRIDPSVQMTTLRRAITTPEEYASPDLVKVVVDLNGDALYFSRAPIPFVRDEGPLDGRLPFRSTYAHIGVYAYRRDFLLKLAALPRTPLETAESLEQLRALEHGFRIRTIETQHHSVGVDTPEDLERVRNLFAAAIRG